MEFKISSDTIGAISEALSKAQGVMEMALKDTSNPFFKSKYADLASIQAVCQKPLSANGICYSHSITMVDGVNVVITTLSHSSGEWLRSYMPLMLGKQDMQSFGSAISYARRYTLSALCGVSVADDDGESAMGRDTKVSPTAQTAAPGLASEAQLKFINSFTSAEVLEICKEHKVPDVKSLTAKQASESINKIVELKKRA